MKILLCGCILSEGSTLLLVAQAISNLGHHISFWNVAVKSKPSNDDYDMAIVWVGRPVPIESFKGKPVAYVYLDDNSFWEKEDVRNTILECTRGYKHIFTNMMWDGYDHSKYTYLPMGCLRDVHGRYIMSEVEKKYYGSDIVFIGTNRGKREQFIKEFRAKLNQKYVLRVYGNGWESILKTKPAYFYDFTKILSASKIVLTEHWNNGLSTNDCEKPACNGALTITDCPQVKKEYPNIPMYHDVDEAVKMCEYYLEHEEERLKLVEQLYLIAYEKFDYEKQMAKMISLTMGQ